MSRWWRAYDDALNNPKLQKLPPSLFKSWFNLCCLSSKHDGKLPSITDIAFALRLTQKQLKTILNSLKKFRLIDEKSGVFSMHDWSDHQYQSDSSSERTRRYRERHRNVTEPVTVTRQSRADTEQSRAETKPSRHFEEIEAALRKASGLENDPSPNLLDLSSILGLLDKGYSLDEDILPVVRRAGQGKSIKSWTYFTNAIVEAKGKRNGAGGGNEASYQNKRLGERRSSITTAEFSTETWAKHVGHFKLGGMWPSGMGPSPAEKTCKAPTEILTEHGYQQP